MGYHGAVSSATTEPPGEGDLGVPATGDATPAVVAARRGFRRDVQALIAALDSAPLLVPLAKSIEGVDIGDVQEVGEELSLTPHLLFDDDRRGYLAVFTRGDLLERATARVGWTTDDAPLEYCTLPAAVVLELGLALVDETTVRGMLVNPFDDGELVLLRHEIASIAQGRALPLVGYVGDIPVGDDEQRLVAQMEGPPPSEVVLAIDGVLGAEGPLSYRIHRTFNPERDVEPHLTLNVLTEGKPDVDRVGLAARLGAALEGKLPPPGYVDILFDDPTLD